MTLTEGVVFLLIILLLVWGIIDEWIVPLLKGPTRLLIKLRRHSIADNMIVLGLLGIVLWNSINQQATPFIITLLLILMFLVCWACWIRRPKLILKESGFFFANNWIRYHRIKEMQLSEDGILIIQLEQRRLLIAVQKPDDLEKIYCVITQVA